MTRATRIQSFLAGLILFAAGMALAASSEGRPPRFYIPGTSTVLDVPTVSWQMVLPLRAGR